MIHIKYRLDRSALHGIGLFADEAIKKGQVVYTASPALDLNLSKNQFEGLNEKEQTEVKYYGFWDELNNVWHVDFDVSRFINHSSDASLTQEKGHKDAYLIAARNINSGEELTQNYLEFESKEDLEKRGIRH